jgi:hypothetical protein
VILVDVLHRDAAGIRVVRSALGVETVRLATVLRVVAVLVRARADTRAVVGHVLGTGARAVEPCRGHSESATRANDRRRGTTVIVVVVTRLVLGKGSDVLVDLTPGSAVGPLALASSATRHGMRLSPTRTHVEEPDDRPNDDDADQGAEDDTNDTARGEAGVSRVQGV